MKTPRLLALFATLTCCFTLSGADVGTWTFGKPALRSNGLTVFIPLVLEGPDGTLVEHESEIAPVGIEFTQSSGLVVFGFRNYANNLTPVFSFHVSSTNELIKLMEDHQQWKQLIPLGTTEERLQSSGSSPIVRKVLDYRTEFTDSKGTFPLKFTSSERPYGGSNSQTKRLTYGLEWTRPRDNLRGNWRPVYELPALFMVFASLDKISLIFEAELAQKQGREFAIDEARKKQIAGEVAMAIAIANKKLEEAQKNAAARIEAEQNARELARLKEEAEQSLVKMRKEELDKRRAKIAAFVTSQKGNELKMQIEQTAKSISEKAIREREPVLIAEKAVEQLALQNALGRVTGRQLQQAINEYAVLSSNHRESASLQQERANLKTLLNEFKGLLGVSYDDAMKEWSAFNKSFGPK